MGLDDVAQSLRVENESRTVQEQGRKKRDQSLWKNKVDQLWLMRGEQIFNIIAATKSSHFTRDFTHARRSKVSGPVSANMTRNWASHRAKEGWKTRLLRGSKRGVMVRQLDCWPLYSQARQSWRTEVASGGNQAWTESGLEELLPKWEIWPRSLNALVYQRFRFRC
jgi:hypothetical protein